MCPSAEGWGELSIGSPFSDDSSSESFSGGEEEDEEEEDWEEAEGEGREGGEETPRGLTREQRWAQGSPLQQALAFRDGSYARFARPDVDADAAKATLIEASEAGAWGPLDGDPWLSPRPEQRQRAPRRRARAKSARAGSRNTRPTSGSMIERGLVQAGAQAEAQSQRPATSLGNSRQVELDEQSAHVDVRREWGASLPRRHADDRTDGRPTQPKDPKAVRVMRWSSLPSEHRSRAASVVTNGRGIPAATTVKDRKPQKDWIKELYERRQRIAKRGQGNAKARVDTRITIDTQARLADILGKDDVALSAAKASQGVDERFGTPNRLRLPVAEPSSQLHWRPPRAASAPPRPLSALGAQERQAAAAVHIGTSSSLGGVPTATGSGVVDSRPLSAAAATAAGAHTQLGSGKLANLTNRQPQGMSSFGQGPAIQHRGKVATSLRAPSSTESAFVRSACVGSSKAPALVQRAAASAIRSSSGGSRPSSSCSASLAARTIPVRRGRPASAAVVTPHSHGKQQRRQQQQQHTDADVPGGTTRQRRPVSAGPFYPSSKEGCDGANGGASGRRKAGMSESAVAQSVAAEAARRNATLLAMRPTSSSSRSSSRSKPTKRPLIVRAA